jgi:hypothetical protein
MNTKKERATPRPPSELSPKVKKSNCYCKSEAVKLLEAIATDEARRLHPNIPPHYIAPRTYRDDTAKGHHCERTGNEGRVIDQRKIVTDVLGNSRMIGSVQRVYGSGMRGTSDGNR